MAATSRQATEPASVLARELFRAGDEYGLVVELILHRALEHQRDVK